MSSAFKKYKLSILILIVFLSPNFIFAQNNVRICSPIGYSIYTINGINTSEKEARDNRRELERKLLIKTYKNEPLTVDFLYNQTHSLGIDLLDSLNQKNFDQNSLYIEDSDFAQMLTDASAKVTTQKVLLVGHSQGNFYANTFYNAVADEVVGVPSQSIGVYSVATPANHVEGSGLYLTSDTDKVIANLAAKAPLTSTLPANVHIDFEDSDDDGRGHSFSDIYLKYQGDRIISDINTSLDKLKNNNIQNESAPCISPPKLTVAQKVQGTALAVIDGSVYVFNKTTNFVGERYLAFINNAGKILADAVGGLASNTSAAVIVAGNRSLESTPDSTSSPQAEPKEPAKENPQESPKAVIKPPAPGNVAAQNSTPVTAEIITAVEPAFVSNAVSPAAINFSRGGGAGDGGGAVVNISPPIPPPLPPLVPPAPPPPPDTTSPVISILGTNPITISVGDVYADAGATALDNIDGVLTAVATGVVDTAIVGIYTITYTATDLSNNIATLVRTVNVVTPPPPPPPDTTPPNTPVITTLSQLVNTNSIIIAGTAETNSTVAISGGASVATGTATDGNYSIAVTLNQNVLNTLSVTATDAANNTSSPATILITHDNIAPVISSLTFGFNSAITTAVVGGTFNLNITADASLYTAGTITINGVPATNFTNSGNFYFATHTVTLGESNRSAGSVPVSVVLIDAAGNSNVAYTTPTPNALAINGQAPASVFQAFPSFTSDGKFTQDVTLDCIGNSGFPEMYYVRDSDSTFRMMNTSSFAASCPGSKQTFISNGFGFEDFSGYSAIEGWYYQIVSIGNLNCAAAQNDTVCANNNIQSFFRLHRNDAGVWSDSTPALVSAEITSANTVDLIFSKDLNGQTVTNADFAIMAHTLALPDAFEITPGVVRLTVSDAFTTGETPEIIYNTTVSNGVKDLAGNLAPGKTVISTNNI